MSSLLSKRGEVISDWEDFFVKYLHTCISDRYDEKTNPMGYVNLGTSVNNMCNDIILPRLTSEEIWSCDTSLLQYKEPHGIFELKKAFAKVMTEMLEVHEEIDPNNLICLTGVTSCIDFLAHCLGDPGDVFLVPTPVYGRIYTNFKQRSLINIQPVPIITADNTEDNPVLTIEKINKAFEVAKQERNVVRGIFLINPNNPLGDIYSPELLMDILLFCQKNSLHCVVDEVFALSVYSKITPFHSILKFPKLPDPERTHVLYGLSKDFGIAGLRVGVIHTICTPLKKSLRELSSFATIPFPVMQVIARYFDDLEWLKEYIAIYQKRLVTQQLTCRRRVEESGLKVRKSSGGFFVWADFRNVCKSFEEELDFFQYLIEKIHLYIAPGKEFYCEQPGWFRIVFTENPNHLNEGMKRLHKAVYEYEYKPPSE